MWFPKKLIPTENKTTKNQIDTNKTVCYVNTYHKNKWLVLDCAHKNKILEIIMKYDQNETSDIKKSISQFDFKDEDAEDI